MYHQHLVTASDAPRHMRRTRPCGSAPKPPRSLAVICNMIPSMIGHEEFVSRHWFIGQSLLSGRCSTRLSAIVMTAGHAGFHSI